MKGDATMTISLKPTGKQLTAWEAAAERAGLSRHAWLKLVADVASGNSDAAAQFRRLKQRG